MKKLLLISLFVSGYCQAGYPVPDCNNPSLTNELLRLINVDLKPANKNEPVFFIDTAKSIKKDPDNYLNICETKVSTSYPNEESITVPVQYAVYQDGENTVTVEYDRDAFWREFDKAQKNMPDAAEILAANPGYFYKIPKNAPPSTYAYSVNQSQPVTQKSVEMTKYKNLTDNKKYGSSVISLNSKDNTLQINGTTNPDNPMSITCDITGNIANEFKQNGNQYELTNGSCNITVVIGNTEGTVKIKGNCQDYCGVNGDPSVLNGLYK
ncbi:hypothetical protein [Escherichia albertii]|uniref:hypothetical protein n=1 Tax=Escherichia albertii TaxID=208962 RepID=UPI000BF366D9|nr:hypothetical protein [Escherichia albertii]PFF96633.1 hypothetical protein CRH02_06820 [Escherichia albertii]